MKLSSKAKQLELFNFKGKKIFGGALLKKANAREARPLSTKKPLHLVLRASLAREEKSFLRAKHAKKMRHIIQRQASHFRVKLYSYSNSGNHLHLLILPPTRFAFTGFIRAISGLIARLVLGVERQKSGDSRSLSQKVKFWDFRPFTRIVEWGLDYKRVSRYLVQNTLEAIGFIPDMTLQELINLSG